MDRDDGLANDILRHLAAEIAAGRTPTLEQLLDLWPADHALVRAEWTEFCAAAADREGPARKTTEPHEALGPYRLIREIGRGGQGAVFLAQDTRLPRLVALKVANQSLDAHAARRLEREARVLSRLDHQGLAVVFDAGAEEGRAWIAMRYVEGPTLAELLAEAAQPAPERAALRTTAQAHLVDALRTHDRAQLAPWVAELAAAIDAAHGAGVVHRDIKPSNVIVDAEARPVLVDFGLALAAATGLLEAQGQMTAEDVLVGTPAWLSPERLRGADVATEQDDLWAFAVVAYEVLTLERPFGGSEREALFRAILDREWRPLGVPEDRSARAALRVVFARAFAERREARFASGAEFSAAFAAAWAGVPPRRGWSSDRRTRGALAAAAAVAAVWFAIALQLPGWFQGVAPPELNAVIDLSIELDRAWLEVARGDLDAAEAAFRRLVDQRKDMESLLGYAMVLRMQHRSEEALAAVVLRRGVAPEDPVLAVLEHDLRLELGVHEAVASAGQVPATSDRSSLELFLRGTILLYHARSGYPRLFERAADLLEAAILAPGADRAAFYLAYAEALMNLERESASRQLVRVLAASHPEAAWAHYACALAQQKVDPESSRRSIDRALAIEPSHRAARLFRIRQRARDPESRAQAVQELQAWLEVEPRFARLSSLLGQIHESDGEADAALEAYARALDADPRATKVRYRMGLIERRRGRLDAARAHYDILVREDPLYPDGHAALGELLAAQGYPEESRMATETALRLDPASVWPQINHALLLLGVRDFAGARRALDLVPHDSAWAAARRRARFQLGIAAADLELARDAAIALREAREMTPGEEQRLGDLERALGLDGSVRDAEEGVRLALAARLESKGDFSAAAQLYGSLPPSLRGIQGTVADSAAFRALSCALRAALAEGRIDQSLREQTQAHWQRESAPGRRLLAAVWRADPALRVLVPGAPGTAVTTLTWPEAGVMGPP